MSAAVLDEALVTRLTEAIRASNGDLAAAMERLTDEGDAPETVALRRRLSLVRWIDADLYALLAGGTAGAPSFEELIRGGSALLAPLGALRPCGDRRWTWTSDAAVTAAERWATSDPGAYRDGHRLIADWLRRQHGDAVAADVVYHLAAANPDAADATFRTYWQEADARYDTARMHVLLEALQSQSNRLTPGLVETWTAAQQYARSRALFHTHYLRTTTFLERDAASASFDAFFDDETRWIFQMHATGGTGKSMFLRRLIAHRLVPEPDRVPCAYFDFDCDSTRLAELLASPARVLFAVLDQIDQQLPRAPLSHVLSELKPTLADPVWQIGDLLERLADVPVPDRVLVVLDTVEEPMLAFGPSLARLIENLGKVRRAAMPGLKLLIAGRYDLAERLDGFPRDAAVDYELPRFTRAEAEKYLSLRRLDDGLSEAVLRRAAVESGGERTLNPFTLSLLAELVLGRDGMTPEDVAALPRLDVAYLIERVIRRIGSQALRWLVRYAAIAQDATPEFVARVLMPELRAALIGETGRDDPNAAPEVCHYQDEDLWTAARDELAALTPEALHEALAGYARERGWISIDADRTIRLHPEVVSPLRRLLRKEAVFDHLHLRADEHYRVQAGQAADDEAWTRATLGRLFHAFQRLGTAAEPLWHEARREALDRRTAAQLEIARAPLGKDFAGAEIDPLPLSDDDPRPIVSRDVLCDAHVAAARAMFDQHVVDFDRCDPVWQRVCHHVERAGAVAAAIGDEDRVPASLRALAAAIAAAVASDATAPAGDAPAPAGSPDAIRRHLLAAGLAAPSEALRIYADVSQLLPLPRGELMVEPADLLKRRATVLEAMGRLAPAGELIRRASVLSGTSEEERRSYCLRRADLALAAHDLSRAAEQIDAAEPPGPMPSIEVLDRRLALAIASWDYGHARHLADAALAAAVQRPPGDHIWLSCAAAQAAAGVYDREGAGHHFAHAMHEAAAAPDQFPPLLVLLYRVDASLTVLRSPALARSMLDSASSAVMTGRVPAFRRAYDLLRVRTELMAGAYDAAFDWGRRSLDLVLSEKETAPAAPYHGFSDREVHLGLVLVLLANGMPGHGDVMLPELVRALPSRRWVLPVLDVLRDCTGPLKIPASDRDALIRLLPQSDPDPALGGADRIRLADLYRVLGDHDRVAAILSADPPPAFAAAPERAFAWEMARERAGLATEFARLVAVEPGSAGLGAAIRIRAARELLARGKTGEAEALVKNAQAFAASMGEESGWRADAHDIEASIHDRAKRPADAARARSAAAEQRRLCDLPRKAADVSIQPDRLSSWIDAALNELGATRGRIASVIATGHPDRQAVAKNSVDSRNLARRLLSATPEVRDWLGEQLVVPPRKPDEPVVLPMPAADPLREIARLPWELARPLEDQARLVRCPDSPAATLPKTAPGNLVLMLAQKGERYRRGSYDLGGSGTDLFDMYRRAPGIAVVEDDPLRTGMMQGLGSQKGRFDVVHIVATLRSGSQGLMLDCASDEQRIDDGYDQSETLLTSHQLKRWLARLGSRPLVILDIIPPPQSVAATEMLFRRNAYADELYEPALMRGVLATGLASPEHRAEPMQDLVRALVSGAPLIELIATLRRTRKSWMSRMGLRRLPRDEGEIERLLLPFASALWTAEPAARALVAATIPGARR